MPKVYKLDKTGSRCRDLSDGKYAKFKLCETKKVERD
jgi:hypothetical protein